MLRDLDVSIPDIRCFLGNRSAQSLEKLFSDQISSLDKSIHRLEMLKKILEKKKQDMGALNNLDLSAISIITIEEPHYLGLVDISQAGSVEDKLDLAAAGAKEYHMHRLYNASYGSMLSVENIYKGNFDNYSALYMELPVHLKEQALHIPPTGKYLRAFCKDGLDKLAARYQDILAYAERNNIIFYDFAYEKGLNEIVIDSLDEYITQIIIPIKSE